MSEASEALVDKAIDAWLEEKLAGMAAPISAPAKLKLRGVLKKYAKDPYPFRACVKDNMARFGPGRTEAFCATLKDTIKGQNNLRKGSSVKASDDLTIDGDMLLAIDYISEIDLQEIFLEARALEEHHTTEAVALLNVSGAGELRTWGERS